MKYIHDKKLNLLYNTKLLSIIGGQIPHIFAIYDDTISEKTKPSSKGENIIQETGFHHSHLKHKQVWGHQLLTTMLSEGKKVLPYSIERYKKGEKRKIEMVCFTSFI